MSRIINRYILREISFPFFMTLFVFTFILLIGRILQVMDLMVNKGVSLWEVLKIVLFLMPTFLVFTIPVSFLISILAGLGRLSADSEITVLKASGVSLYQILYPVVFASLIVFAMTAIITFFLAPYCNYATRDLLFNIAKQRASISIKEKVFNDDFKGLVLYADRIPVDGNFMEGVFASDTQAGSQPNTIIAQKGYLISDPASLRVILRFEDGSIHTVDRDMKNYRKMDFRTYDINLDLETAISEEKGEVEKKRKEMSFRELAEKIKESDLKESVRRELAIELNKKISIPFSCIVFGILGLPLGIVKTRTAKSRGFTVGLLVVLTYYILQLGGTALAETGKLPVIVGVWAPNLILGIAGIYVFAMAAKERPLRFAKGGDIFKRFFTKSTGHRA